MIKLFAVGLKYFFDVNCEISQKHVMQNAMGVVVPLLIPSQSPYHLSSRIKVYYSYLATNTELSTSFYSKENISREKNNGGVSRGSNHIHFHIHNKYDNYISMCEFQEETILCVCVQPSFNINKHATKKMIDNQKFQRFLPYTEKF